MRASMSFRYAVQLRTASAVPVPMPMPRGSLWVHHLCTKLTKASLPRMKKWDFGVSSKSQGRAGWAAFGSGCDARRLHSAGAGAVAGGVTHSPKPQ